MINGSVNTRREAVISIDVLESSGRSVSLEAVVDTGFTEFLTLPPLIIAALKLRRIGVVRMILGDGSVAIVKNYKATVIWDGSSRTVEIQAGDLEPLVGMRLLAGYELRIQVAAGGAVTIEAMP